jgi:molecular chaperone GrpE
MAMPNHIEDEVVAKEAPDMASLAAQNASLRDSLLRALADAENARRQAGRAAANARKSAIADFAREILVGVDNLQRTIDAIEGRATAENAALLEGVEVTHRIFIRTLAQFGVHQIAALGQRFDPTLHEAIMEVDDPSQPPGTVVRVVEPGYMIQDQLLRPARVFVTKRPVPASPEPDDVIDDLGSEWAPHGQDRR